MYRAIALCCLLSLSAQPLFAQPTQCAFSCPSVDQLGQALLNRILAIPYESDYSVFECVYGQVGPHPTTHSCFYGKSDGQQVLGSHTNNCPAQAVSCSEDAVSFSSPGKPETPPWIENGRWLLYLKENHT